MNQEWAAACLEFYPHVLTGKKAHYCDEFDGLPIDETCHEINYCTCVLERNAKEMNTLYRFCWDWGRMGVIEGLFVATPQELDEAYGSELDFDEALGKHSEVRDVFQPSDITVVSTDQEFVKQFAIVVGSHGYNPLLFRVEPEPDDVNDNERF